MPKFITVEEAVKLIPDGATVMFGGFMGCGNAHKFIDALSKSGVKDLTMISNDASMPGGPMGEDYYGVAKLVHNKQIKKLIATHVGLNPEVATQSMVDGTLEVQLIPQGSLAEMIRASIWRHRPPLRKGETSGTVPYGGLGTMRSCRRNRRRWKVSTG